MIHVSLLAKANRGIIEIRASARLAVTCINAFGGDAVQEITFPQKSKSRACDSDLFNKLS